MEKTPQQQAALDNAAILTAFANGREIQYRMPGFPANEWKDSGEDPAFNFQAAQYRVKPREWKLYIPNDTTLVPFVITGENTYPESRGELVTVVEK